MIIMKSYFQSSIPQSIQEAAIIDGCSQWKLLVRVILPSKPVLAVIALSMVLPDGIFIFHACFIWEVVKPLDSSACYP